MRPEFEVIVIEPEIAVYCVPLMVYPNPAVAFNIEYDPVFVEVVTIKRPVVDLFP